MRFKPGVAAEARQTALAEAGASEQHNVPTLDLSLAKLTGDANDDALLAAAKALEANPDIAYAEPNYRVQADAAVTPRMPNDPSFGQQWGLDNTGQGPATARHARRRHRRRPKPGTSRPAAATSSSA